MKYKEALEVRERLSGAYMLQHPFKGLVFVLKDGSYMTTGEYKDLSLKSLMFLFRGR